MRNVNEYFKVPRLTKEYKEVSQDTFYQTE